MAALSAELKLAVDAIQERLQSIDYPFAHARGTLSMAEYARLKTPADNEWVTSYLDANSHVERLFALHYQPLGRVLAWADRAEQDLDLGAEKKP